MRFETKRHRRWTAVVLVMCCAVGVHQGGAAQVLCIGEDGHVEVESYGGDCCTDAEQSSPLGHSTSIDAAAATNSDNCGACIDIPLTTSGRVAPIPVNQPNASAWTMNTDAVSNHAPGLESCSLHVFAPYSPTYSSTTVPLLL